MTTQYCNAYGAENRDGIAHPFGGFLDNPVAVQPECHNRADHRFVWVCACGHRGQPVALCKQHYDEFTGSASVPWNIRRDVRACPRCASLAQAPELQHKCKVRLVSVS